MANSSGLPYTGPCLYVPITQSIVHMETQGLMTFRLTTSVLNVKCVLVITNHWELRTDRLKKHARKSEPGYNHSSVFWNIFFYSLAVFSVSAHSSGVWMKEFWLLKPKLASICHLAWGQWQSSTKNPRDWGFLTPWYNCLFQNKCRHLFLKTTLFLRLQESWV